MENKFNDSLVGSRDVLANQYQDPLLYGNKAKAEKSFDIIDEYIENFLKLTPFEFEDSVFVANTIQLDCDDFVRALYRVYLRRESEHLQAPFLGNGLMERMQAAAKFRRSPEFQVRWGIEIQQERQKKSGYFNRVLSQLKNYWNS